MSDRYGIVYLGSKEKILDLIKYIFEREYKQKNFIDLFCGGLSVSSFALQKTKFNVYANDLNHFVIALYKELLNGGHEFKEVQYDWISREQFNNVRDFPEMFPDWYVGYVLNVWSFGCNQKDYLYAKDIEYHKMALHEAIVNNDFKHMNGCVEFDGFIPNERVTQMNYRINPRKRIDFMAHFKQLKNTVATEARAQHLERLEQLESLSQMEHLSAIKKNSSYKSRLTLSALDWEECYNGIPTDVLEQSFIYCDPPYQDAKKYLMGGNFDYDRFWQWFRDCPYSVYVSSYKAPEDIKPLNFGLKAQLLDNGKRGDNKPKKVVQENIYWNGKGTAEPMMIDILFGGE